MRALSDDFLRGLLAQSASASRGRINHNLHEAHEVVQRMLNIMQPGSYVTPHKHENPDKVELICPLIGRAAAFQFDDDGQVTAAYILDVDGPLRLVDIAPRTYHTFFALTPVVMLEIIQGPYDARTHKKFAPWAPLEGEDGAADYMRSLLSLLPES